MRRTAFLVMALGACGRLAFDPNAHDSGTSVSDAAVDAGVDAPPLPCSNAGFACGTGSVVTCGNTCFATCATPMTWSDAQDLCLAWGGNLARTDLSSELACLANEINDAWIALVQAPAATAPADGWRWTHGGPIGFTAWQPAEPDDGDDVENGVEQCGLFSAGGWIDNACAELKTVACSRPAPVTQ